MAHDISEFEVDINGMVIDVAELFAPFEGLHAVWRSDDPLHKIIKIFDIAASLSARWRLIAVSPDSDGGFWYFFRRDNNETKT